MGTAAEQAVAWLLREKGDGSGSIRHSKRFNFLTQGGYILVPFSGIGNRRSCSATSFHHLGSEGPKAQMKVGKPNRNRIQPVRAAINSPNRSAVWHHLILRNGSFTRRQP